MNTVYLRLLAAILFFCASSAAISQITFPTLFTANTVYVDATYGNDTTARRERSDFPFQTLAAAYSAASNGDTLIVRPGSYTLTGTVTVTKNKLKMFGYGARLTYAQDQYFVALNGDDDWFIGFEIDGQRTSSNGSVNGAIYVGGNRDRVSECYVHNYCRFAVQLGDSTDALIENNRFNDLYGGVYGDTGTNATTAFRGTHIIGNRITSVFAASDLTYSGGIKIHSNAGHYESKCLIANNYIFNAGQIGIEEQSGNDALGIENNYIYGSTYGISLDTTWDNVVTGNRVRNYGYIGLEAAGNVQNTIYSNNVVDARDFSGSVRGDVISFSASNTSPGKHIKVIGNTFLYGRLQVNTKTQLLDIIDNSFDTDAQPIVSLATDNVQFRGNRLRSEKAADTYNQFIYLDGTSAALDNINIINNSFSAVAATYDFGGGGSAVLLNAQPHNITNVSIIGNNTDGAHFGASWLQVFGTGTVRVKGNTQPPDVVHSYAFDQIDQYTGFGGDRDVGAIVTNGFPMLQTYTGTVTSKFLPGTSDTTPATISNGRYNIGMKVDKSFAITKPDGTVEFVYDNENGVMDARSAYELNSTAKWTSGTGSPEGVVTAPVGSLYSRTDGGPGSTLYVKELGSGSTGWSAK